MSPRTEPDSGPSPNNHFPGRLVAFLVLTASSAYLCRVDVTVVAPRLMAEFQLSQAQMGELFSAFLVGYTAFQIPSGWVAEPFGGRQSPHAPNGVFRGAEARVATSNDSVALAAFAAQLLVFGRKLHTPGLRRLRLCVLDIHLSSPGQGFRPAESRLAHS